ncbi:MAG: ATPase V, partial [Alistipes sp.]|nr:ATPase V [Candidatus Minthomonas equi]
DVKVCAALDAIGVYYIAEPAKGEDCPPIKLKNNCFTRNFETLTGMYGMPVYDEFDPTPILAPFFTLFCALCLGDCAYGFILIWLGHVLKKVDILGLKAHHRLVTTLGVGTVIIGFFLGAFMGFHLDEMEWIPEGLRRCMLVGKLPGTTFDMAMVAAIIIGVFHLCLAMVVKAIGLVKRFGFSASISAWGWIILIVGGIATASLALADVIDSSVTRIAVIVIGIFSGLSIFVLNNPKRNPLINIASGLWDAYGMVTGLMGDTLSYIRLYALGLAGGMLGNTFNNLGMMVLGDSPSWHWAAFAIIFLIGHAINFAMGCLGAFVHPLRLTFVEYFKNSGYEGKGSVYNPMGVNDK